MTVSEALRRSAPLTQLRARLQESADRFEAIRGALPGALARHVRPGPIDEEGWSLLVANAAVAASRIRPRAQRV